MNIAIMQPYFFPYIGYWQLMNYVDVFVIYDIGMFRPHGWINRNRIKNGQGEIYLTVPIHRTINCRICDMEIVSTTDFRGKMLRTLQHSYGQAPHFRSCYDNISKSINYLTNDLTDYLYKNMLAVVDYLGISTKIVKASDLSIDYREGAVNRIVDICDYFGIHNYINPIGGISLYSKDDLKKFGVNINFIKSKDIRYAQGKGSFIENLSIIDVMMYNSIEQMHELLQRFEII